MPKLGDARTQVRAARFLGDPEHRIRGALIAGGWSEEDAYHILATADVSTSGLRGEVPREVTDLGFCWGALGLTWIWGIANRVWIALAAPFLFCLLSYLGSLVSPEGFYLGGAVSIAFAIYLGVTGHARAWRARRFESLRQFRDVCDIWNTVGIVAFVVKLLLFVFFVAIFLGGLANPR